jgi:cyclic pyranopterin phosphate synthase
VSQLIDPFNRRIDYLRVSVTDRCNYRCFYCMPSEGMEWERRSEFLDFDEMTRLIRLFSELGVSKVRFTGGEPLVRREFPKLVRMVGALPGVSDLSLSTNAHMLAEHAADLYRAGVERVNISLDSLDADTFRRITRNGDLEAVIRGIDAALAVGMNPVKLNMVIMKGLNDHEIESMLEFAVERGADLRFIETMPVGSAGIDGLDHYYPADDILRRVREHFGSSLVPVKGGKGAGPAAYYQVGDGPVRLGVITAMSRHFCEGCNRVRLTARGELVLCLGQENSVSLRDHLRAGLNDDEVKQKILEAIAHKPKAHDFTRDVSRVVARKMSALGG